ncbi:MAG: histidine kinase [Gammaproteobacteria bacterium HGW-Gammaproteobacteria-10]|nr:MAG: histidine kinase [Gammaproteobacteria bacterium HGW-Gammaproteobacteria-10]
MVASLSVDEESARPGEVLMHELLIHKIELELQNEELRKARASLEDALDRYVDLYEFAPVAYITINWEGLIGEINLTGAALLGVDRAKLINNRFSKFFSPQDNDRWYRLFLNLMEKPEGEKQKFGLTMMRADGTLFSGYLDCLRRESLDASPMLRVALTDITQQIASFEQTE